MSRTSSLPLLWMTMMQSLQTLRRSDDMARHLMSRITDRDAVIASLATVVLQDWHRRGKPPRPTKTIGKRARLAPRPLIEEGLDVDISGTVNALALRPAPSKTLLGGSLRLNTNGMGRLASGTKLGPILKVNQRRRSVRILVPNPHMPTRVPVCWITLWKMHPKLGRARGVYLAHVRVTAGYNV